MKRHNFPGTNLQEFGCQNSRQCKPVSPINGCENNNQLCNAVSPLCTPKTPLQQKGIANDKWGWHITQKNCSGVCQYCEFSEGWKNKFECDDNWTCHPLKPVVGCQAAVYRRTYVGGSRDLYTPTTAKALPFVPIRQNNSQWSDRKWNINKKIVIKENPNIGFNLTMYEDGGICPPVGVDINKFYK